MSPEAFVFCGPTLSVSEGRELLDAVYLPPAAQGDVYRVTRYRPRAIGIIDGYFEQVPAVWHKEILHALSNGVAVFGSASMGALRAAELESFGMAGVGRIYDAYVEEALTDDDEVAVAHASETQGYRMTSEAMVNIRFTLESAVDEGVVSRPLAERLVEIGKELFYPERSWPRLLDAGRGACLTGAELDALERWLPANRVDQKRLDAIAMLEAMRSWLDAGGYSPAVRYKVEHTLWWDHLMRHAGAADAEGTDSAVTIDALLDELRIDGSYATTMHAATARHLAVQEAKRLGVHPTTEEIQAALNRIELRLGLHTEDDVDLWLSINDLDREGLISLARDSVLSQRTTSSASRGVVDALSDHLRISGRYSELLRRAREKERCLDALGLSNPAVDDTGLTREELVAWHAKRVGRPVPVNEQETIEHARWAGWESTADLLRSVAREHLYLAPNGER